MCKVDDLIEDYGLTAPSSKYDSVDDYLATRWVGDDCRYAVGYKPLTDWFNKRVLSTIYRDHDRTVPHAHLSREYTWIVGDDTIERTELAADLEADGLDIDELAKILVSHGTVRKHLRDCLGAEKDYDPMERRSPPREKLDSAKHLASNAVTPVLDRLASSGELPLAGDADLAIELKVTCPECHTRVPVEDALARGYICGTHSPNPPTEKSDAL